MRKFDVLDWIDAEDAEKRIAVFEKKEKRKQAIVLFLLVPLSSAVCGISLLLAISFSSDHGASASVVVEPWKDITEGTAVGPVYAFLSAFVFLIVSLLLWIAALSTVSDWLKLNAERHKFLKFLRPLPVLISVLIMVLCYLFAPRML